MHPQRLLLHADRMKHFAPVATAAVASLLLMGCETEADRKREICARFQGEQIEYSTANEELGLKADTYPGAIARYCEFYKQ